MKGFKDGVYGNAEEIGRAVARLVADGDLVRVPGARNAQHHYLPGEEPGA